MSPVKGFSATKFLHIASITGWFNVNVEMFHETSLQRRSST
ncbi:hypothetical protein [Aphanizomenon flos-aquae]|nr:hypothetical protein [Aphanizomenon flos-aquae]